MKRNWCQFCESLQTKIGRHMALRHKNVPEVQLYLKSVDANKSVQKRKRREITKMLINESNKIYNENVIIHKDTGKTIPVKKSKSEPTSLTHVVCSVCGGLLSKKHFSNHKLTCQNRKKIFNNGDPVVIPSAKIMGPPLERKFHILQTKILDFMNKDEVRITIQNDPLILEYGRRFLKGHMATHQRHYVAMKMRTLADLLLRMKKIDGNIKDLKDCLHPTNFNNLCEVIKQWSSYDEETGICKIGSIPRRLCKSIKECSQVLWTETIKNKYLSIDEQLQVRTNHEKFISLMETDFKMEINSVADKSLKVKKLLGDGKMPIKDDIVAYFREMTVKIQSALNNLNKKKKTVEDYDKLCKASLAYLIAFNGRRPSEVAYATVFNYENLNIQGNENDEETLCVFNVTALKNNVKVPIIVPRTVRIAINTLLKYREYFGVSGNLLLCRQDGTAYNGTELISKFKSQMQLKKPDDFTANGLRHYWATISQMNPDLKSHMPKFLGHTMATHQKFYEMPMADIHLKVVGPIMQKHCLRPESISIENSKEVSGNRKDSFSKTYSELPNEIVENNDSTKEREEKSTRNLRTRKYVHSKSDIKCMQPVDVSYDEESMDNTSKDPDYNSDDIYSTPKRKRMSQLRRPVEDFSDSSTDNEASVTSPLLVQKRNRWTTPEKKELFEKLPKTVLGIERAGRGKIKETWENSKIIKERHSLQMTRIEISKYFTKKKKIPTPDKVKLINLSS